MKPPKIAIIFSVTLLVACSTAPNATQNPQVSPDKPKAEKVTDTKDNGCDPELWKHIYDPSRLEVVEQCKEVTGIIEELGQNEDGDTHMLLKLDAGQEDLLNKKNEKKKNGDLVIEIVCSAPVTDKKVGNTCVGYTNNVHIPKVGDAVKVTGSYVIDTHNGWSEIHPVSRIEAKSN